LSFLKAQTAQILVVSGGIVKSGFFPPISALKWNSDSDSVPRVSGYRGTSSKDYLLTNPAWQKELSPKKRSAWLLEGAQLERKGI